MAHAPLRPVALALALAVVLGAAGGCATSSGPSGRPGPDASATPGIADDFARSRLVAADFVDVIRQLPALAPGATALTTPVPSSRFGELLFGALQDAGYDMRIGAGAGDALGYDVSRVDGDPGDDRNDGTADEGAGTYTFLVRAGAVKLKRDYAVDADGIRPVSTMLVHGADASAVVIDHARFARRDAPTAIAARRAADAVAPSERSAAALTGLSGGAAALRTAPGRASASPRAPVPAPLVAPEVVARAVPVTPRRPAAAPAPRRNLYETRRSAFAPLLAGYDTLDKRVMVFPNDSLVMGADNKRAARRLAARFDAGTDLVSLIGCSHGTTALANGNETLALGRAARVKEELMLAGIDPELVLDEGCWAGRHFDKMPARGVVVTHVRRAAR